MDVDLVLDFLNTVDADEGTDVLDDDYRWRAWLAAHRLTEGLGRQHARAVRDAIRHVAGDPRAPAELLPVAVSIGVDVEGVPRLVAPDAAGAALAAASRLVVLGEWERIKICPAEHCGWAFYDRSRNRSRTWCSMRVCGNREKARAWRERQLR
jgi:hypothetical protein